MRYTQTKRQRERQTDRQRETEKDKEREETVRKDLYWQWQKTKQKNFQQCQTPHLNENRRVRRTYDHQLNNETPWKTYRTPPSPLPPHTHTQPETSWIQPRHSNRSVHASRQTDRPLTKQTQQRLALLCYSSSILNTMTCTQTTVIYIADQAEAQPWNSDSSSVPNTTMAYTQDTMTYIPQWCTQKIECNTHHDDPWGDVHRRQSVTLTMIHGVMYTEDRV